MLSSVLASIPLNKKKMFKVNRDLLSDKEYHLLKLLESKYNNTMFVNILRPLATQQSPVSLRTLDWTVVNWSKGRNVVCSSLTPGEMTNIHESYIRTLTYWKRRLFDPFRRRKRIQVVLDNGTSFDTTLGQAHFAQWIYSTGILGYVIGHMKEIELDMNRVSRLHRSRDGPRRRKRSEITTAITSRCAVYTCCSHIDFS